MNKLKPKSLMLLVIIFSMTLLNHGFGHINTIKGPLFNLTAKSDYIVTPDGGSYLMWGYALGEGRMQYTGPVMDVNEGDTVTVNLTNELSVPASIVFPGQVDVNATGDSNGLLTKEANPGGGTAQYSFKADYPGTYLYHSGTNPELQIEMGLVGALIVRPAGFDHMIPTAYEHMDSMYNDEFLFLLTEMDPTIHEMMECGGASQINLTDYWPVLWFINGRCAPDTMVMDNCPLLPTQPHSCMPMMRPGDKILLRFLGGSRHLHPFHTHGNNFTLIAEDGRLLESASGNGADLSVSDFTQTVAPGCTYDAIFTWTGEKLGWDIYGHDPNDMMEPNEYAPDHGKPFPVVLPSIQELTIGAMWSGSPFLGALGALPPGEGGLNPNGGYMFMWHSHKEKEMTNNDIFPGGMMTMLMVEPHGMPME